jgi:putative transposase
MLIAHRIALDPHNKQRRYFARAAGTARFAYNWALSEWKAQYEARKLDSSLPSPSEVSLRKKLNSLKREQFPWMFDVTKSAAQEAIILTLARHLRRSLRSGRTTPVQSKRRARQLLRR